jgi:hypothetical protein
MSVNACYGLDSARSYLEVDEVLIGARAGNNERLESTEGKVAGAGSQERKGVGDQVLVLEKAVEALLLTLLANDRSDAASSITS